MTKSTMNAVVFKGTMKVEIEDRPIPKIIDPSDVVIKVQYSALCGSIRPSKSGFIMGDETTGRITESGSSIKTLCVGDLLVLPFTASCGECSYCSHGFSSRCTKSLVFGCPLLDGGQAEYLRVPLADATAVKAPEGNDEGKLVPYGGHFSYRLLRDKKRVSRHQPGLDQEIPWSGNQAYDKNLKTQMGRCPLRSLFPEALETLRKSQHLLGFMTEKIMPLSQSLEEYEIFNDMEVQKVVFVPEHSDTT